MTTATETKYEISRSTKRNPETKELEHTYTVYRKESGDLALGGLCDGFWMIVGEGYPTEVEAAAAIVADRKARSCD